MSADFAQKEREFLTHLKADTGRDLAEWMSAIAAQKLEHRNDIIDWLRQQGFIFARASWLERIHHNGGQPIYLMDVPDSIENQPAAVAHVITDDAPAAPTAGAGRPSGLGSKRSLPMATSPAAAKPIRPDTIPGKGDPTTNDEQLEALYARAKAYAPLARFLVQEVRRQLPDTTVQAATGHIQFANPGIFAILAISPRQLHLGLCLRPDHPYSDKLVQPRFPAGAASVPDTISHMILLDDARQIDNALIELIGKANTAVNI